MQTHLAEITGATLPILAESEAAQAAARIVLGDSPLTRKLLPSIDPASLAPDGIVIKTVGPDLVLVGHPRRGTLYAVYTFLEDTLGVRWWTQTETYIPKRPTLTIPRLDIAYAPKVIDARRYLSFPTAGHGSLLVTEDEQGRWGFSPRLRLNGHDHYSIPDEYGGPNGLIGWVHTFYQINGFAAAGQVFRQTSRVVQPDQRRAEERTLAVVLINDQMREEWSAWSTSDSRQPAPR